jgi:predicted Zn-dependent protease
VHYNLGVAYVQHGQTEAAIQKFHSAVSLDPEYLPARYARGMTLLRLGRPRQAANIFSEARKQSPRDPQLWAALVEAQFGAGDSHQAVKTAENAIQAIPNNPRLAVTLASDCLRHREIQTARNLLEDADELMPENAEIRILLAKANLNGWVAGGSSGRAAKVCRLRERSVRKNCI